MDGYVLSEASSGDRMNYKLVVARILLADRIAFGRSEALWLAEVLLRAAVAWVLLVAAQSILNLILSNGGQQNGVVQ